MASRTLVSATVTAILWLSACRAPEATSPNAPASPDGENAPHEPAPSAATPSASNADAASAPATSNGSAAPSAGAAASGGAPTVSNERPGPPLPELRVKSFGLHVGGAAKDGELRSEVQRTLERGFHRYLDCYRLIEEPGSEGTFGADLRVAAEGGKAKVEQPRTKLRGEAFRACMIKSLESARFEPPSSGRAIVVSYSVKFSFAW